MVDLAPLKAPGGLAADGRILFVMGLGGSGLAAARALSEAGIAVLAWDDAPARRAEAAAAGIALADPTHHDLAGIGALVLSPGIPQRWPAPHPAAARARAAGVPILGDLELLGRVGAPARFIGITGTNGKSTTTALVHHILVGAGQRAAVGGNLGPPALGLPALGAGGWYVLEVSSYQAELSPTLALDIAALTNFSPDHLDRHGGMDGYVAAKEGLFAAQPRGATAVVGVDDPWSSALADRLAAARPDRRVIRVTVGRDDGDVHVRDGRLVDRRDGTMAQLTGCPALPGAHNWQNAAIAWAVARAAGVAPHAIAARLGSFPGLAHRQQLVATRGGVRYVNDSKATNAEAAGRALACYGAIHWILGGRPKAGGLAGLEAHLPRIRHAWLIGEAAAAFQAWLGGRVPSTITGTLEAAVDAAHAAAQAEASQAGASSTGAGGGQGRPGEGAPVVLLSPACASFDQFRSFEERGERFVARVRQLLGEDPQ